jgi:hypothetical protein
LERSQLGSAWQLSGYYCGHFVSEYLIEMNSIAPTVLSALRKVVQHAIVVDVKRHKLNDTIEVNSSKSG